MQENIAVLDTAKDLQLVDHDQHDWKGWQHDRDSLKHHPPAATPTENNMTSTSSSLSQDKKARTGNTMLEEDEATRRGRCRQSTS